jgi:hypothetical protein
LTLDGGICSYLSTGTCFFQENRKVQKAISKTGKNPLILNQSSPSDGKLSGGRYGHNHIHNKFTMCIYYYCLQTVNKNSY